MGQLLRPISDHAFVHEFGLILILLRGMHTGFALSILKLLTMFDVYELWWTKILFLLLSRSHSNPTKQAESPSLISSHSLNASITICNDSCDFATTNPSSTENAIITLS